MLITLSRATLLGATLLLGACQSTYYAAMEQVGVHKRDILVDRVEAARDAQGEAQQEFQSALERFQSVVKVSGGELQQAAETTWSAYSDSQEAADAVHDRIEAVDEVAEALFSEWEGELEQYSSDNLRRQAASRLRETRQHYDKLLKAMRAAEKRMQPVLSALKDNALFLKHNLNAQAIGAIQGELHSIEGEVERLIQEMGRAIDESNRFLQQLN